MRTPRPQDKKKGRRGRKYLKRLSPAVRTPRPQEGEKKRKKKKKTERTQNLKRRQPGVRIWGLAVDQAAAAADFPSILLGCNSLCSGSPGLCWPVPGSQEGGCPSCMQSCSCARLCLVRGRGGAWLMWQVSPEGKTKNVRGEGGRVPAGLAFQPVSVALLFA